MPKTPRYIATIEGLTFTRDSNRTYTHVVVARDGERYMGGELVPQDDTFGVIGFCGSLALAEKLAKQTREKRGITGYDMTKLRRNAPPIRNGALIWRDVTILALIDTRA